jgi:hypothetical protein
MIGKKEPNKDRTLSGTFQVALNITDRRQIMMTGQVYSDDTPQEIHRRVDLFQEVLDRQGIRADVINKEAQITMHLVNIEAIKKAGEALLERKRAGRKLTSQEKAGIDNYEPSLQRAQEEIDKLRIMIAEGKKKLEL